ncbi:hypothetical protein POM88_030601 [Heracleum sosnowskyi]|uniref:Uncharacterized protein n=1 Tax=Heracleum sosnowskyi TaxID=360622 RepID=A0AAD8HWR4_9APIA|nr:hypothetical protein POM88_030601 [Heracleum sosnowskyi]
MRGGNTHVGGRIGGSHSGGGKTCGSIHVGGRAIGSYNGCGGSVSRRGNRRNYEPHMSNYDIYNASSEDSGEDDQFDDVEDGGNDDDEAGGHVGEDGGGATHLKYYTHDSRYGTYKHDARRAISFHFRDNIRKAQDNERKRVRELIKDKGGSYIDHRPAYLSESVWKVFCDYWETP